MTPESILRKYIGNMHYKNEAEVIKAMQEYASLRDQEVAAAAWEASKDYYSIYGDGAAPNKEQYLKSLK